MTSTVFLETIKLYVFCLAIIPIVRKSKSTADANSVYKLPQGWMWGVGCEAWGMVWGPLSPFA